MKIGIQYEIDSSKLVDHTIILSNWKFIGFKKSYNVSAYESFL